MTKVEIRAHMAEMQAEFRLAKARPLAGRLRRIAEKMLATASSLESTGGTPEDLQALRRRTAAIEAKWDGLPKSPVEWIIREVVRGNEVLNVIVTNNRDAGDVWVGPRAISWSYIEEYAPAALSRSTFALEGWERFDAFRAGTSVDEQTKLLIPAIALRRCEELDELLDADAIESNEAWGKMARAMMALHFAKGKQGPKSGTHAAFRALFNAWGVRIADSALKMALSRGLKKYQ